MIWSDLSGHAWYLCAHLMVVVLIVTLVQCLCHFLCYQHKHTQLIAMFIALTNILGYAMPVVSGMAQEKALMFFLNISILANLVIFIFVRERFLAEGRASMRKTLGTVFWKLISSPFILAAIFGLAASLMSASLPRVVIHTVDPFTKAFVSIILICIGAELRFDVLLKSNFRVGVLVFIKGIVAPLLAWLVAWAFSLNSLQQFSLILVASCPPMLLISIVLSEETPYETEVSAVIVMSIVIWALALYSTGLLNSI